jgi:Protein of unknown function (DUF2911)
MKHIIAPLALLALPSLINAQDLPAPSPTSTIQQTIGLTDVKVEYSRPCMKGRRIFGDLVPYNEVWRTGANKATLLTTKGPLTINGQVLAAGGYSVFTIPNDGAWVVIFNSNTELWGAYDRKVEEDVLTVKCATREAQPTECFTIAFDNLGKDNAELVFRWDRTEAAVLLEADAGPMAMENIKVAIADPKADFRTYARSASFYLDRGLDDSKALEWAAKSVSMEKKYWNVFTLAKAQAANGKFKEAAVTGSEAVKLAEAEKDGGAVKSYGEKVAEWNAKGGK